VAVQRARAHVQKAHMQLLQRQLLLLADIRSESKSALLLQQQQQQQQQQAGAEGSTGGGAQAQAQEADPRGPLTEESGDREEKMEVGDEVALPGSTYWWQDKYRPRKPRYFNRVKTGWDRTKYNLTHYDHDNPPPKMIQGYKFTIFYPDLIDKTKTPRYFLEPCADGKDFAILRFHAGPPYEDVAFKIINKEWDIHRRSGFVCVFDRGVLTLNFNFKRTFYRR
jgi:hypothetical protein